MLSRNVLRLFQRTSVPTKISFLKLSLIDNTAGKVGTLAIVIIYDVETYIKERNHLKAVRIYQQGR